MPDTRHADARLIISKTVIFKSNFHGQPWFLGVISTVNRDF